MGHPVFLISGLAEHTRNLERDHRSSLLVAESSAEDPLANGRVTMLGRCKRVEEDGGSARAAFLTAHPNAAYAAYYADFRDFAFWKLRVNAIRYIGATDGCLGSARPTGRPPSQIPSRRPRPARLLI